MIIDLTDEQVEWLGSLCAEDGISRAEAVRRAIDSFKSSSAKNKWERDKAAVFGIWKDRGVDALEYERTLRDEWERDDRFVSRHFGVITP